MSGVESDKFFKILCILSDPKIHISNDVYLEMLITHLSGKYDVRENNDKYKDLLKSSKVLEWIEKSVENWENGLIPNEHTVAFTLRILALIIENGWQFTMVKEKLLLDRIQCVLSMSCNKNDPLKKPIVYLANVELLKSVSQHVNGLHWIERNETWKVIVEYCEHNHTVYVVRESLAFIYTILQKFAEISSDTKTCEKIMSKICQPLIMDNPYKDLKNCVEKKIVWVDDVDKQKQIMPSLNIVCYIMQKLVESNQCNIIAKLIIEKFNLERYLWGLANSTQDNDFLGQILKGFVLVNFISSMLRRQEPGYDESDFNKFGVSFFNYMNFCICRGSSINVIMMAELNHKLWRQLQPPAPNFVTMESEKLKFEDQLIILQILPILIFISGINAVPQGECLDTYVMKLFNISCERNIRLCYAFRDLLRAHDLEKVTQLASKSIQGILSMKNHLHRDRAILVLQALIYTLQEFSPCRQRENNTDLLLKTPGLLSVILTGLHTLIKNYRITWKECIESTVLVNFMMALLYNPNLLTRHSVQALQLIQLSIEHFLAPNLALLVDTVEGSGMENLGPVIFKKLHDNAWEIRDSALELLSSMVRISETKFPPFQSHILDTKLCPIVWTIVKNDNEFYVRASALQCLTNMVNISSFWDNNLSTMDLLPYTINLIYSDSEGVIRKEATCLLIAIYEQKRIPKTSLDLVFSIMAYAAVNDLYWEVKTNALKFWKVVMCRQFQHQGVIDNIFPSVTFSKEHKKIVTLNEKEILLRLTKVLNELSVRGCLGVLLRCLDDNCDLEVLKVTVTLVERLKSFLDKYHYLDHIKNKEPALENRGVYDSTYNRNSENFLKYENNGRNNADMGKIETVSDSVLDAIVGAQDVSLLAQAYENQMRVDAEHGDTTTIDTEYFKEFATVTADAFLERIKDIDLNGLIKVRSDWIIQIENFDSLLDDILYSFKDNVDINDADCY